MGADHPLRGGALGRAWPLAVAVALAVVTWPLSTISPATGLDASWETALAVALRDRMSWGDDLVFTYGPLGFLENPLVVSRTGLILGLLWTFALQVGVLLTVILAVRRSLPWWAAVAVAWVVGILSINNPEPLALLVFLWCAMAINGDVGGRLGRVLVPVAGSVCAVALLDKSNVGLICIAMAALAVPWLPPRGWRALGIAAGAFAATFAVLWLALGQAPGEAVPWLRRSLDVASGFSAGLPLEDPSKAWEYPAFAVGVAGLAYLAWQYAMPRSRARALCLTAVALIMAFAYFKHGFVRHDVAHSPYTFVVLMAAPAAFAWRGAAGRWAAGAAFIAGAVIATASLSQGLSSPADLLDPPDRVQHFGSQMLDAVRPGGPAELRAEARARIRREAAVPPQMIAAIGDGTVHIDPYETSVAWAYGLRWRPVPVFQLYSAYTATLDRLDADALRAAGGPDWILREAVGRIGDRGRENEAPSYSIAMFCEYAEVMTSTRWELLRRTPGRCGPPRDLGSAHASPNQMVRVPQGRPGELVYASFDLPLPLRSRLRTLLYKPRRLPLEVLNENYGTRFAAALGPGDFLMVAPATLRYSDYASGFGALTLKLQDIPVDYRVTFHAVRVAPAPPARIVEAPRERG